MGDLSARLAKLSPAQRQLLEEQLSRHRQSAEPIAIVGMACRFPGAANLRDYWELLCTGREAIREIPPDRWDAETYYDSDFDAPGKMATRWGAFLDGVDQFDPQFFGITPREAARMDPQQRLLLEVAWEAFENAGLAADAMRGSATGVFVGIGGSDYAKLPGHVDPSLSYIDAHVGTGNALSIAANRISYVFDLRGPSLAVDTACSSALVGIHLAVECLRNRQCDAALAGGVNLILSPEVTVAFSKARMLSPDGHCRPFDARANGYVRGEGCGLVVLKRLADAVRDGDRVLAVIRGSAINQDGRTSGITAPNSRSQVAVIIAALAQAERIPVQVGYIEAHGTGTPLGDPIEVQALAEVFRRTASEEIPCRVASVKSCVGHLETASGVAGLIKVVLMLQHGKIPPQPHLAELNPHLDTAGSRLEIVREAVEWPQGQEPRLAGVSSFGFGGTNAHLVIEDAPPAEARPRSQVPERPAHLLALSAKTPAALRELAGRYLHFLDEHPQLPLADVCYTANAGRSHHPCREIFRAADHEELRKRLDEFLHNENTTQDSSVTSPPRSGKGGLQPPIGFLFTGQGSQYVGMGKRLFDTQPTFRRILEECQEILRDDLEVPLLSVIFEPATEALLNRTAYTQPALFAIEYALARLWQSWGIEPDFVLGHSIGEYAAACIAGVFDLETGLRLIARRAACMQRLPENGLMAAVFADAEAVQSAIGARTDRLAIAAYNGPGNTVVSGEQSAMRELLVEFERQGIGAQLLPVSHAFHSPLMDPVLDEFDAFTAQMDFTLPEIPFVSTLTGGVLFEEVPDAHYWRRHIREGVKFADALQVIAEEGAEILLEIGPTTSLLGMGRRCLPKSSACWLPSLRKGHDDWRVLLDSLSTLYRLRVPIDWRGFDRDWPRQKLELPTYPFQRTRHWFEVSPGALQTNRGPARPCVHPLLGYELPAALETTLFENRLQDFSLRYLHDHQVQGSAVLPAAAYLEQALAAATQLYGPGRHIVENLSIQQALYLQADSQQVVQVTLGVEQGGERACEIFSRIVPEGVGPSAWTLHACGSLRHQDAYTNGSPPQAIDFDEIRARVVDTKSHEEFYELMAKRGVEYGPAFRVLHNLQRSDSDALGEIRLPEEIARTASDYILHPALGDACLQAMALIVPLERDGSYSPHTYLPVQIQRVRLLGELAGPLFVYAVRTSAENHPSPEAVEGNVSLVDEQGVPQAILEGVRVQRLGRLTAESAANDIAQWLYQLSWRAAPLKMPHASQARSVPPATNRLPGNAWLIFADRQGVGEALADALTARGERPTLVLLEETDELIDSGEPGLACRLNPLRRDHYEQLLQRLAEDGGTAAVHVLFLGGLDSAEENAALDAATDLALTSRRLCGSVLRLVQALARRRSVQPVSLWIVTRGAVAADDATSTNEEPLPGIEQSPLWGLGRVIHWEFPDLQTRLIDLDPAESDRQHLAELLLQEVAAAGDENQIAWRGAERRVARLAPAPKLLNEDNSLAAGLMVIPRGTSFRLHLGSAGQVESLRYVEAPRRSPEAGQVEIEIQAAGLNFSDVLKSLGLYPGLTDTVVPLGIEAAGVVTAVGAGVQRFAVGDSVFGIVPYSFASHAVTTEHALVHLPADLSAIEAATIPIAFLTAYYALVWRADLQPGERVLIHAGAGGVGLAAIQIAQHLGAEVFATAGSERKREALRARGVPHVLNSRTLEFADEVLARTGRRGVDVVLNSLPGEMMLRSLSLLAPYGRFLEIGKTDIYQNRRVGLLPFQDNLSYFAIDLDRMFRQRPAEIGRLFAEVMQHFVSGAYRPLPFTGFAAAETIDAFRYMQQRKNIGKVVVSLADEAAASGDAGDVADNRSETALESTAAGQGGSIRADGTYLITGGTGGLGLLLAEWLARQGARSLALLARRPAGETVAARLEALRSGGVSVALLQGDVADRDSLRLALGQIPAGFPPLRGVFHAAGVLADGALQGMEQSQFEQAFAPKVEGAWNLHLLTRDAPLDVFVMFSSVASILGSPGQGNYAAGNAFLDSLAHYRRRLGLPAVSINWGPWAEHGMAVDAGQTEQLVQRGMKLLPGEEALKVLSKLLRVSPSQAVVLAADWQRMRRTVPGPIPPLLREVMSEESPDAAASGAGAISGTLRRELLALTADEQRTQLRSFFTERLVRIMGLDAGELNVEQPLNTLGLDSLMAIELKNDIETRLDVVLPMARFMEGPSIAQLAEQVALLLNAEAPAVAAPLPVAGKESDRHPLSRGQQALWFIHRLAPESTAYSICDAVQVQGPLDLEALRGALQTILDRHAAFRTTFHDDEGVPYQRVHEEIPLPLCIVDASNWDEVRLREELAAEVHRPFDLESGPLLRVTLFRQSPERHRLVFVVHHIIADFWSLVACTQEFREAYAALHEGRPVTLPEVRLQYSDFTRWQSDLLGGEAGEAQWAYWREQLAGELPVLNLPTDRPRPPVQTFRGALVFHWLDSELTARLRELGERHGATLNMVLLAAYQTLLYRYSGQEDILVGAPTSGRTRAEFAPVVGYFVNPVVIRGDLSGDPPFARFLEQIRDCLLGALDHQDYPFPLLVERLAPARDPGRSPLIQAMFVTQKAQVMHEEGLTPFLMGQSGATLEFSGLTFESMTLEQWVAQFDLSLAASEANGGTSLGLQYNTDLFEPATAARFLEHYARLLADLAESPEVPVSRLRLLSPEEESRTLHAWNATDKPLTSDLLLHQRIEQQVERTPEAVAVVCGAERLTYRELNERANRLAHGLRARGLGANDRVGLCVDRSLDLLVGLLGILKAGGAYVPLDPAYPPQRLAEITRNAGMSLVLTQTRHRERLVETAQQVVCLDESPDVFASFPTENPPVTVGSDDLIYVIYTSGSTGTPKGAGVYQRGFANLVEWYLNEFSISDRDRTLVVTSHGFDLTQKNLFAPLIAGGQIHLSTAAVYDPQIILSEIAAARITLLNCTPSNLYPLLEGGENAFAQLESLRHVFLGGEPIDLARLAAWDASPLCHAEIVNTYGPTECTDVSTCYRIPRPLDATAGPIPIGRPIANVRQYVLDRHLAPVPVGVTGELWTGGIGVGAGYIAAPEMTAERFLPDPFRTDPEARIYRTGDLCRYRPDGNVEFVGRADHQIKLRGFRIELGEIESVAKRHPAVRDAVVVVHGTSPENQRLAAYVVLEPDHEISTAELDAWLREHLPDYQVPAAITRLDALPLTPHGKLDRRGLPAPEFGGTRNSTSHQLPRDDIEIRLIRLWEELLHVRPIGIEDDFFALGGHSLLAVQLISRIEQEFGCRLPLASLFRGSHIAALAEQLRQSREPDQWSPLVPIQPGGSRLPLFCIHPVGGNVLCYYELARSLPADQPVYAIQARGAEGTQPPRSELAALLDEYIAAIRSVQSAGPYQLAGWSSGGVLAYELARRLKELNEEVASVSLFDSRPPWLLNLDPEDDVKILLELAGFLRRFYRLDLRVTEVQLRSLESGERLEWMAGQARSGGAFATEISAERLRGFVEVCRANLRAIAECQPVACEVPVHLFRAAETSLDADVEGVPARDDLGWGELLNGQLRVQPVPGDHVSMLTGENARHLAEHLMQCLHSGDLEASSPSSSADGRASQSIMT